MLTGEPYPIKGTYIQTSNLLGGNAADLNKHHRALMNMEFNVVVDVFHNPTSMAIADIVLPAACFTERNSIRVWHTPAQAIRKLTEPRGEARNDWEINFELALQRICAKVLEVDFFDEKLKPTGYTFKELIEHGGWVFEEGVSVPTATKGTSPFKQQARFRHAHRKGGAYSTQQEAWGLQRLTTQNPRAKTPLRSSWFPLVMISAAQPLYFHSSTGTYPGTRKRPGSHH